MTQRTGVAMMGATTNGPVLEPTDGMPAPTESVGDFGRAAPEPTALQPQEPTAAAAADAPKDAAPGAGDASKASQAPTPGVEEPPAWARQLVERNQLLERQYNDLRGMVGDILQHAVPQRTQPQGPTTAELLEKIKSGDGTGEDLVALVDQMVNQRVAGLSSRAEDAARLVSAETRARGVFTAEKLGKGMDYDSVVGQYVQELERQNPALTRLINEVAEDPAAIRYYIGLLRYLESRPEMKSDPVSAVKLIVGALEAPKATREQTVANIQRAAQSGAAKILGGAQSPARASGDLTPDALEKMSDQEFAQLMAANGIH